MSVYQFLAAARKIYRLKGFPREELVRYFHAGKSPEEAVELAVGRRQHYTVKSAPLWLQPIS